MKFLLLVSILAMLLAGCGEELPPAQEASIDTLCSGQYKDGDRVAITGYPAFSDMFMLVMSSIMIHLFEEPGRQGDSAFVSIPVGTGSNEIEDPQDSYTDDDLVIRAADGQRLKANNRIRVEARLLIGQSSDPDTATCSLMQPIRIYPAQ